MIATCWCTALEPRNSRSPLAPVRKRPGRRAVGGPDEGQRPDPQNLESGRGAATVYSCSGDQPVEASDTTAVKAACRWRA